MYNNIISIILIMMYTLIASLVMTVQESCLSLTTSPPSYSENLCWSESHYYTFICDVKSLYIAWNFNNDEIEKVFFGHSSSFESEHRGHTDDYDYQFVLHLSERLPDGNYTMRSSLTIHLHNHSLTQFNVTCSTHCGRYIMVAESKRYQLAGQY